MRMLHIILMLLKIIGIIILSILGLLLLIILVCLFVPVVYRVRASKHDDDINGMARVWWLFIYTRVAIDNLDKEPKVKMRIFGIPLEVYRKIGGILGKLFKVIATSFKHVVSLFERKSKTTVKADSTIAEKNINKAIKQIEKDDTNSVVKKDKMKVAKKVDKAVKIQQNHNQDSIEDEDVKEGFWNRIKTALIKVYYFPKWLYERIQKIYLTIRKFCGKMKQWQEFLTDETFKRVLRFVLGKGKTLIKHILPRKITGNFTYGFEDPAMTGQILAGLSIIAPLYKGKFKVTPMFNQKVLAGDICMKGHIFGFVLARIAWSVYCNKDIKKVVYQFSNKEVAHDGYKSK